MNSTNITPVSVWTATGVKNADRLEIRYIHYVPGQGATADCHLWADTEEVASLLVNATQTQCENWLDDAQFFAVLAANAGLTAI